MEAPKNKIISISLIIPYQSNKLLLQLRDLQAKNRAGLWSFFGGESLEGETPLDTAIREYKEELDDEEEFFLYKQIKREKTRNIYLKNIFYFKTNKLENKFRKKLKEGQDAKFFNYDQIRNLPMKDIDKQTAYDFLQFMI